MRKIKLIATSAILSSAAVFNASAVEVFNNGETNFNLNGNVSIYLYASDGDNQLQDGFSRFYFDTSHKLTNDWKSLAKLEWGVKVSSNSDSLHVDNGSLTSTGPAEDPFWLRMGYVGLTHKDYGTITLGKQWGVTYNVTGITDVFDVFGSAASGVYNFGTDGGFSGAGRAEQAIQYSYSSDDFYAGFQYQATDEQIIFDEFKPGDLNLNVNYDDSYAIALTYKAPYKLGFGLGFNKANLESTKGTLSSSKKGTVISGHMTYSNLRAQGFQAALLLTKMDNHEFNDAGQIMDEATGIEIHASYRFANGITPLIGYNSLKDGSTAKFSNSGKYHLEHIILGVKYLWIENTHLYAEYKIDASTASSNEISTAEDAIGIGMAYAF
ncbi:porin [Colwellia sp. 12G3]|uniref:porin n=1 Tax=Colwellia sp. 12G3 TaxID=2058299 RepID=UPI000C346B41|nr:porin [Colwellia sp. 12G3]PKI14325.1 hypothetical protein CXF71_17350 [Colwellia sp. 12G3]